MKKFFEVGRGIAFIGALIGVLSVVGIIGFSGGWVENGYQTAGIMIMISFISLGMVALVAHFLPKLLDEIEVAAIELAEEAKFNRQKQRYVRCRKIAACTQALKRGMSNIAGRGELF